MTKRSACATLQLATAPSDRTLNRFPQAYHPDATPYHSVNNFNSRVKEACHSKIPPVVSGLRVAKVILIGDSSVGKTSVANRFCHKVFSRDYKATIGVDFEVERFDILGIPFNIQIWDTAGQEKFRSIASSYYRNAHVVVVAFDVSKVESLTHCAQWFADALPVCSHTVPPFRFLIGNKLDVLSHAEYLKVEQTAVQVATDLGAEYWPLSAKTGERVAEFFFRLTALLFNSMLLSDISDHDRYTEGSGVPQVSSRIHLNDLTIEDKSEQKSKRFRCCK